MIKDIYIATYKPNHTVPSAYDSYEEAMKWFNPETQFLLKVQIEVPDVEATLQADVIKE